MAVPTTQELLMVAIATRVIGGNKGLYIMPYFIGGYLDSLMMGVVISQMFTYWQFVKTDRKHIVGAVFVVAILTAVASVIILLWTLHLFIWEFSVYVSFLELNWVVRYASIEIATILVVQSFYVDRACRLWSHWWPAVLMIPCVLASAGLGSAAIHFLSTYEIISGELTDDPRIKVLAYSWLSFVLATDLMITVIIAYGLYRIRSGFSSTNSKLRRLLIRCFETQTPALVSSAICLIMWNKKFEIVLGFIMIQSKIFSVGLLITLNLRAGSSSNETNVSKFASSNSHVKPISANCPMETALMDQAQPESKLDRPDWHFSPRVVTREDIEMDHQDNYERPYGSTAGLNVMAHRGSVEPMP